MVAPGFQIRRGSNEWAATIVSTTTAMKYITPMPGATDISGSSCTSAVMNATTKTSSIDQRPISSTSRYSLVRSWLLLIEPSCTVIIR